MPGPKAEQCKVEETKCAKGTRGRNKTCAAAAMMLLDQAGSKRAAPPPPLLPLLPGPELPAPAQLCLRCRLCWERLQRRQG
jgi:hypothetical protein